ncbi:hypothetical protein [Aurantiacibacter sp. D1-12]|uniref:hypothetical protein n=1 Tax=Aurantiacibacter sp. D1-12 TaxID=2993658 RepID=UPI00237CC8C2|nr:hypothetical protein [Aurantiacibacter sp. D1-12]MDE1468537.1 hypothetical protein [Aurantiacibacter sp. D1-12]
MAKALSHDPQTQERADEINGQDVDWRGKVSDHVAWGLLVYTGLHIFVTMTQLKSSGGSLLPYFALVVLVGAIIPACRWVEKRWDGLSDGEASDEALAPQFKREMGILWLCAVGLPIGLTMLAKGIMAAF